jgi:endonuclease G
MRPDTISDILRRIAATSEDRARTRALVASGAWRAADDDATRCAAFDARVKRDSGLAEAVRGTKDFQPAAFLPEGAAVRRAVARVVLQTPGLSMSGTGFLISPELFMTNQHVIGDATAAAQATVVFDDELDERGRPRRRTIFRLAPERCALFSDEEDLDYALIAVGERVQGEATLEELGYCPISFTPDRHRKGMNVNIIQHPEGMPKTIAIRHNLLTARTDTRLLYETDTDFGSSGAPVFNDQWDVVALHHYGASSGEGLAPASAGVDAGHARGVVGKTDLAAPAKAGGGQAGPARETPTRRNAPARNTARGDRSIRKTAAAASTRPAAAVRLHVSEGPALLPPIAGISRDATTAQVNEGIRISSIYEDLQSRLPQLDAGTVELLRRALSLWVDPTSAVGKQLERRSPAGNAAPAPGGSLAPGAAEVTVPGAIPHPAAGQIVAIPLTVTVTLGAAAPAMPRPAEAAPVLVDAGARMLKRLPERAKVDTDYGNRNGYDAKFVPGLKLDLARIAAPRKGDIAPLRERTAGASAGELRYQNFSVVMHKARRFALLTATNIDGATWLDIDRRTGQPVAAQAEGDVWYNDTRIDASYFVGQSFYSGWSHLFDRGHLTRRVDPTWGEFAARANADTFHFTNCTPQHWKFNQSLEYWQGIERYVLEKGVFDSGRDKPVTVLQGPVFDDVNDMWADDVQIPSAFWKVVVWKGAGGLKAVALVADQTALFPLARRGSAPPPDDTPVDVLQWRASIPTIESKTGLNLAALRAYDTVAGALPTIGEALMPVTRWEDIPLE